MNNKNKFKDGVWITLKGNSNKDILIGNIYRSGTLEKARNLDQALHETMKKNILEKTYQDVIVTGDFNYKDIVWSENKPTDKFEDDFLECIKDCFLYQLIDRPTRYRTSKDKLQEPSLLDLILSSDTETVENIEYNPHIGGSDHITLNFTIRSDVECEIPNVNNKPRYQYYKSDIYKLQATLDIDWSKELEGKSSQEAYDIFLSKYEEAVNLCVPKKKTNKPSILKNKPIWMKPSTERLIKQKHHAWIKYLNTKHPLNYQSYKEARNKVSHAIYKNRRDYEEGIAREIKKNAKAFWKYVNSHRKHRRKIPDLIKKDKTKTKSDTEKANALNQQFQSVFTNEDKDHIPSFPKRSINENLAKLDIKEEMVLKKLKNLRPDKTPGKDNVHPFILKNCAEVLCKPLRIIYQTTIDEGILPKIWKEGLITPIFKKGKKSDPENYRPVTLTSIPCKILESLIVEAVLDHLTKNNIKNMKQHGFTKFKSTVTNLLQAINIWLDALSHKIPVDVIYFDYSKAFDKVPHERLLHQLASFGITENIHSWIKDFLSLRTQKVNVNGYESESVKVTSGVPQGSVLGPILFLLYVHDVPSIVKNFISLFADDTKLFSAMLEGESSTESLQEDISCLTSWSEKMMMSYNIDKCHTLHIGKKNPKQPYILPLSKNPIVNENYTGYTLETPEIKEVTVEKDLGVLIDNELSFHQHIDAKISKANQMIGLIRKTFKYIDIDIFNRLYKAIVRPHVEYADIVWAPTSKHYQDKLEKLQRRATRMVKSISHLSYEERLKELQLPTLKYRRTRSAMLFLYKYTHGLVDVDLNTHCTICDIKNPLLPTFTTQTRGHDKKFHIQYHLGMRQKFFTSYALPIWNRLKSLTVEAESLNAFKNRLTADHAMPAQYSYSFSY